MSAFTVEITDLAGAVLGTATRYADLEVTVPLNDSRTARVSFVFAQKMEDGDLVAAEPVCEFLYDTQTVDTHTYLIGALNRMLRVYYHGDLIFWGPLLEPDWEFSSGTVTIEAHDPTIHTKAAFARYADDVVGPSGGPAPNNPLDYRTVRKLFEAAANTAGQTAYPDAGIDWNGTNDATKAGTAIPGDVDITNGSDQVEGNSTTFTDADDGVYVGQVIEVDDEIRVVTAVADDTHLTVDDDFTSTSAGATLLRLSTVTIERGSNIMDEVNRVAESRYGPDWELEPRDDLGDTPSGHPYYGQVNTYEKQGQDRGQAVVLRYVDPQPSDPDEPNTLSEFHWRPGGSVTKNNPMMITQGEADGEDGKRAFGHDLDSWTVLGIYSDWQNPLGSNAGTVSQEALNDYAHDYARGYARPPNFLECALLAEPATGSLAARYMRDYIVGDEVAVYAQKGLSPTLDFQARITEVKVAQADSAGNVQTTLQVVPSVTDAASVASGADS